MNHEHTRIMADLISRAKRYQWGRDSENLKDLEVALLEVVDLVHSMLVHLPQPERRDK